MTLMQLCVVLLGRWRSALVAMGAVLMLVAAATALLWFFMPRYTAQAALVLDVKTTDPTATTAGTVPAANVPTYMATQVDVLRSERVALQVIDTLKLDRDPDLRADWQEDTDGRGNFRAWLADHIVRKLDARPGRESNVIGVRYTAKDADRASDITNAFIDAFVNVTLQLRVEPARQYYDFFDQRTGQLRDQLEVAQNKLSAYQREHGILATDEKVDVENQRLAELTTQMVLMQTVASESSSRQRQATSGEASLPEVLNNSVVSQLTADRSKLEAQMEQLRARLGEQHPQVVELAANVAEVKARLAAETRKVAGSVGAMNSVNQSRLAEARAAADQQRGKLLKLKAERDELAVLMRDVEHAQKAYDAIATLANQSHMESQSTQTNVSVLQRATPPPFPSSPNLLLSAAGGALLALLAGAMTAVMRELRDPRLRTDDDVRLGLAQPLVGVLPLHRASHRDSNLRRRLTGPAHAR